MPVIILRDAPLKKRREIYLRSLKLRPTYKIKPLLPTHPPYINCVNHRCYRSLNLPPAVGTEAPPPLLPPAYAFLAFRTPRSLRACVRGWQPCAAPASSAAHPEQAYHLGVS